MKKYSSYLQIIFSIHIYKKRMSHYIINYNKKHAICGNPMSLSRNGDGTVLPEVVRETEFLYDSLLTLANNNLLC